MKLFYEKFWQNILMNLLANFLVIGPSTQARDQK
jgi:hypothetical protein